MADVEIRPADANLEPAWPTPSQSPADYFPTPNIPDNGVFEVGLVMGGTVSAGAFTAGVLDFLFEALDQWDDARGGQIAGVPTHSVRIRVMTGTSGGGINALLAARALHYRFPPATSAKVDGHTAACLSPSPNPFYEVWVNDIDITGLLNNSDLQSNPIIFSLLNGDILQRIASTALDYPSAAQVQAGQIVAVGGRSWVYNPLTLVVTHSNLGGIPYRQQFAGLGVEEEFFTNHADYVQLYAGFSYGGAQSAGIVNYLPGLSYLNTPDSEKKLAPATPPSGLNPITWQNVAQNALGTSAFPVGLPARMVARNGMHYAYRFVLNNVSGKYEWITPLWSRMVGAPSALSRYAFTSLDGGCTDNEPLLPARQALEGLGAPSRFEPDKAKSAIILVDPLCDPLPSAPASMALSDLLGPTVNMLVGSNRFATADMVAFLDPSVFNRFLIAPSRTIDDGGTVIGGEALCGEGLGAFLGFLSRDFREHDFMLGRRNCQAFLRGTLTLLKGNKVFNPLALPSVPDTPGPVPPAGHCPVIPLYGTAKEEQPQPNWPTGKFKPTDIQGNIKARVHLMLSRANSYLGLGPLEKAAFNSVVDLVLAEKISEKIVSIIQNELGRKSL